MKYKDLKTWFLMVAVTATLMPAAAARAQRVFLVVNRETGAVDLVSNANISVDGYTVSSAAGRLNPESWNSFSDQGDAAWLEANPQSEALSELNWTGSRELVAGQLVSFGAPYNGGQTLPPDEDVLFSYSTPDGNVAQGAVSYIGASLVPTISVDRSTGQVDLSNPAGFAITGYSISAPGGGLIPAAFNSLADQNIAGWIEANPLSDLVSELNLEGELAFSAGQSFSLGNIYGGGDLAFQYSTPAGTIAPGVVDFVGATPDLVLEVDLLSGAAKMQNMSSMAGPFDVVGYSITSASGALSVEGWNSLQDQGVANWGEANPTANAIAELNPTSSILFENGTSIDLGNILAGTDDLVFQYGTPTGTAFGTVEYVLNVGGGPLTCDQIAASRLAGDVNGDGSVGFPDFLVLSANFGQPVGGYDAGDINCDGSAGFPDFLILSANFGASAGAAAAAVPEPATGFLSLLGVFGWLGMRRRR